MNEFAKRMDLLRQSMKERDIDLYLVETADFHQSEYVGIYFKVRAWLCGFTGSAGTLVVSRDGAYLFTDGRYFIQAARQLEGSGTKLMKIGEDNVPSVEELIQELLPEKGCLGFDGRTVSTSLGKRLQKLAGEKGGRLFFHEDLADALWTDRPELSKELTYLVDIKYAGVSREEKLEKIREATKAQGANAHLVTSLDDIAWMLNIRGNDIPCNPVVLSSLLLTPENAFFYVQEEAVSQEFRDALTKAHVHILPYFQIYEDVKQFTEEDILLMDENVVNYTLFKNIPEAAEVVNSVNPGKPMKACKNETEMENIRLAHIKDGKAMCRFLYWLKQNVGKGEITEYSASEYSLKLRREDPDFLDLSFDTICASGANAAMCHYSPSREACAKVEPKGFFLIDSGGQYWQGTTDITRTVAAGALTREQMEHFTLVLKGNIRLATAKFMYGCSGAHLDYLARGPLWERGLDFNHGTGHGVGYLLNVHEGPQTIHWNQMVKPGCTVPFEEGVLISDEPGLYLEGQYGIRSENLLLCHKDEKNAYGQFMSFEVVTLAPFDRDAIIPKLLGTEELGWLNAYHKRVYDTIGPLIAEEEREWLKEATAEIVM